MEPLDAVVVGGGVIGLACARAFAGRGLRVALVEAATGAREASWAAAGILGAGSEFEEDVPLFRVAVRALEEWPADRDALESETGVPLGWSDEGTLLVALDDAEPDALSRRADVLAAGGIGVRWLSRAESRRLEPRLAPDVLGALRVGEARIDNRRLWTALRLSCERRGVVLREGITAQGLEGDAGGAVTGVATSDGVVRARRVVVATGAWSEALARTTGLPLPCVPVKGQLARLDVPDGFLRHVVRRGLSYAVPRTGAGVVVGTTSEEAGFSRGTDEAAIATLLERCARFVPGLRDARRLEAWSGLRPRLPDGLPAIGPVPERPGLSIATGHYRNGIHLCLWTARALVRATLDGDASGLEAFRPERFGAVAVG